MARFSFNHASVAGRHLSIKVSEKTQNKAQKIAQQLRNKLIMEPSILTFIEQSDGTLMASERGSTMKQIFSSDIAGLDNWCENTLKRSLTIYCSETKKISFHL